MNYLATCFLIIRLSQYHISTVWSGMEAFRWSDNSVEFTLPVSCKTFSSINVGDDFLQSMWIREIKRGNPKKWRATVVGKTIIDDGNVSEFECY